MEASSKPRGFSLSLKRVSQPTRFTAAGVAKQSTAQSCVYFMIIAINYCLAIVRLFKHPSDAPSTQRRFTSKRFQGGFMVRSKTATKAARVFSLAYLAREFPDCAQLVNNCAYPLPRSAA